MNVADDSRPALSFDGTTLYFSSAFRAGNVSQMFEKLEGPE
jgi:hypothetical protein